MGWWAASPPGANADEFHGTPGTLYQHTAVFVPPLDAVVVLGGFTTDFGISGRAFVFSVSTHAWHSLTTCAVASRARALARPTA